MSEEKLKYIERLRNMSVQAFETEKKSPRYVEVLRDKDAEVKKAYQSMFTGRMSDMRKREKILELMYTSPDLLFETIQKIQTYRNAKYKHKIKMAAFKDVEKDKYVIQEMQEFDTDRRKAHNEALASFCRLVLATSPGSNKRNTEFEDGYVYTVRTDSNGDLYTGELMNPLETGVKELPSLIRSSMTDGMIKGFLGFLERTYSSDWEKSRHKVLDRLIALGKISEQDKESIEKRGKSVEIDHVEQDEEELTSNAMANSADISSGRRAIQMFHQQWHGYGDMEEYQKGRYIYGIERLKGSNTQKKRIEEDVDR